MSPRALRAFVSAALILAATLFAIGVAIERHDIKSERRASAGAAATRPSAGRGPAFHVLLFADADLGREPGAAGGAPRSAEPRSHRPRRAESSEGETAPRRQLEPRTEAAHESAAQIAREHGTERIFGINPDSTALVAAAIVVSLALAISTWLVAGIGPLVAVAAFALGAAAFDAREVAHQLDESRTTLVVIASTVACLHLATTAAAAMLIRKERESPSRVAP